MAEISMTRIAADLGVKPLSARSVVAAALMRTNEAGISASALVRAAELFGVSEGAARVAMSRMTSSGEITVKDGEYQLAGRMAGYQRRPTGHRWPELGPWDGTWLMQVVTVEGRSHTDRQALRKAMVALRFAELAGGSWMRPNNIVSGHPPESEATVSQQCDSFLVAEVNDAASLSQRLWNLSEWNARARRILTAIAEVRPAIEAGSPSAFAPSLVVTAAAVVHISNDPMLPEDLTPGEWCGQELRSALDAHDASSESLMRERTSH